MLALPPVAPAIGWRTSTRLARDHYVRLVVADHERIWARHQTISAAEHVAAARALRAQRVGLLRLAPPAPRWRSGLE